MFNIQPKVCSHVFTLSTPCHYGRHRNLESRTYRSSKDVRPDIIKNSYGHEQQFLLIPPQSEHSHGIRSPYQGTVLTNAPAVIPLPLQPVREQRNEDD